MSINKKTIKDINLTGKNILLRVDYNVDFDENNQVLDDGGIQNSRPTINYLNQEAARLFIISHLGRPSGKKNPKLSLKKLLPYLKKTFHQEIKFSDDFLKPEAQKNLKSLPIGSIVLLENIRFWPGERSNDRNFAGKLSKLGDIFVNDCFGASHRFHASIVGLAKFLPAVAGLLLEKEFDLITNFIHKPNRPFVAVIGGVKLKTRLGPINRLVEIADSVLIGGDLIDHLSNRKDLILPEDVVAGDKKTKEKLGVFKLDNLPDQAEQLDIGPKSRKKFSQIISQAKTIIWNGPMGLIEKPAYQKGTETIFQSLVKNKQAVSLVGGGDTLAFLRSKDKFDKISYRSTGGGAMLELIKTGSLPGITVLDQQRDTS